MENKKYKIVFIKFNAKDSDDKIYPYFVKNLKNVELKKAFRLGKEGKTKEVQIVKVDEFWGIPEIADQPIDYIEKIKDIKEFLDFSSFNQFTIEPIKDFAFMQIIYDKYQYIKEAESAILGKEKRRYQLMNEILDKEEQIKKSSLKDVVGLKIQLDVLKSQLERL